MKKTRSEMIEGKLNNLAVPGWIFSDLEFKGNEALLYAVFYATRKMKLQKPDVIQICSHIRIAQSTFYNIRDDLCKKGLLELTGDGKEEYYYVKDPLLASSKKANKITERYEQNSAIRAKTCETEILEGKPSEISSSEIKSGTPSQLGFFGAPGQSAYTTGIAQKENQPAPAVDKNTASVIESVSDSSGNPEHRGQAPEEKYFQPDASGPLVSEPGHMTKEIFCCKWEVEYDGTEDISGLDWDRLDYEFGRSKDLQKNPQARSLEKIIKYRKLIYSGKLSDEAIAKRKEAKERMEAQAAAADYPERQDI